MNQKAVEREARNKQEGEANAHIRHNHRLGGRDGSGTHHVNQATQKHDPGAKETEAPGKEDRRKLPGEIAAQFKGVDLSDVVVVHNSKAAKDQHVQGFATKDVIYLAPGADEKTVLRHEAAHVVQFRKGAKVEQHDTREKNEAHANAAEAGQQTDASALGTAPAHEQRNKEEHKGHEEKKPDDNGAPKLTFNGMHLDGATGTFKKSILEAESGPWKDGIKLWSINTFWPIPGLPIAGVELDTEGMFSPKAELSAAGTYTWKRDEKAFELEGSLEGGVGMALSASVLGGLSIGAVGIRVGVGVEAKGTLNLMAKAKKAISLIYNYEKNSVAMKLTPLELEIGGALDLDLALAAFFHGWFSDHKKTWTFASFRIATFEGFKWPINIQFGTDGIKTEAQPVMPGRFSWGKPPEAKGEGGHEGAEPEPEAGPMII
jgi:hypothetical protein